MRAYHYLADGLESQARGKRARESISLVGQVAAIAGMTEEAKRLAALADHQPRHPFFWLAAQADIERAYLEAYLGNPEGAWERLEPWADDPSVYATRAYLRVAPREQYLFGQVLRFQEFIGERD